MKITRKYYVASQQILVNKWAHPTLAEAIKHAEELLDTPEYRRIDTVAISQIVRVVKRKSAPVVVEKVE